MSDRRPTLRLVSPLDCPFDAVTRALLSHARHDEPTDDARARVWEQVSRALDRQDVPDNVVPIGVGWTKRDRPRASVRTGGAVAKTRRA